MLINTWLVRPPSHTSPSANNYRLSSHTHHHVPFPEMYKSQLYHPQVFFFFFFFLFLSFFSLHFLLFSDKTSYWIPVERLHTHSTIWLCCTKNKNPNLLQYSQVHLPCDQSSIDGHDYRCPSNKGLRLEVRMERVFWSREVKKKKKQTNRFKRSFWYSPGARARWE